MQKNDGWGITCQCGHFNDYEHFEVFGQDGHYQCPECGIEWSVNNVLLPGDKLFTYIKTEDHAVC